MLAFLMAAKNLHFLVLLLSSFLIHPSASQPTPQNIQVYFPISTPPLSPLLPPASPSEETASSGSSSKTVVKAVAATAASSLVLSGVLFLLVLKFKRRSKKEATTNLYAADNNNNNNGINNKHVLQKDDEFVRVGGIKGVIVDEQGLDVFYWKKLENNVSLEKENLNNNENGGRRKSKFDPPVQEIPFLNWKFESSTSHELPVEDNVKSQYENLSDSFRVVNSPLKPVRNQEIIKSQPSLKSPPYAVVSTPASPPQPPPLPVVVEIKVDAPPLLSLQPPPPVVVERRVDTPLPPPPPVVVERRVDTPLPPPPPVVVERKVDTPLPPPPPVVVERKVDTPLPPPPPVVVQREVDALPPPPPPVVVQREVDALPPPPPPVVVQREVDAPPPPPPPVVVQREVDAPPSPSPSPSPLPPPPPPPVVVERKVNAPPPPLPPKTSGMTMPMPPPPPQPPAPPSPKDKMSSSYENLVKFKPLHWDKVNANVDHSMVWHKLYNGSFRVDDNRIESFFGTMTVDKQKPTHGPSKALSPNAQMRSGPSSVFLLDTRRSQNIAIVVKSLAISRSKIIDCLQKGKGLDMETLEKLTRISPTKEEVQLIKEFKGDVTKLADAESFLHHVLRAIPSAFTRVNVMLFKSNFRSEVSGVKKSLQTLEMACTELKTRGLFVKLLEAVLKAGNRMNVGTSRGNAQAFNLKSLLKLSDVKSIDGKTTLLHFVVEEVVRSEGKRCNIKRNNSSGRNNGGLSSVAFTESYYIKLGLPVVGGVSSEFSNVKKAAGIDYDAFSKSCSGLSCQLEEITKMMDECDRDGGGGFVREMSAYLEEAKQEIQVLREEEGRIMGLVKITNEYYQAGTSKDIGGKQFQLFVIIRSFLDMVDKACLDIAIKMQKTRTGGGSPDAGMKTSKSSQRPSVKFPILPANFKSSTSSSDSSSSSDSD